MTTCPQCKSTNIRPELFDDTEPGKVMRKLHPNAKRCADCKYMWWVTVPPPEPKEKTA